MNDSTRDEPLSTMGAVKQFVSLRAPSLAIALALLALIIGGVALRQALNNDSFNPVSRFRVEFHQGSATTGTLTSVHLSGHVEDMGDSMTLFLFSQWVSREGQVTTGPTLAGGALKPGDYNTDIDLFVPAALPPGQWRLVLSGIVLSGPRSQAVAAVSTTLPPGDNDYLTVAEGG